MDNGHSIGAECRKLDKTYSTFGCGRNIFFHETTAGKTEINRHLKSQHVVDGEEK